jgi:hypothetical protein
VPRRQAVIEIIQFSSFVLPKRRRSAAGLADQAMNCTPVVRHEQGTGCASNELRGRLRIRSARRRRTGSRAKKKSAVASGAGRNSMQPISPNKGNEDGAQEQNGACRAHNF